MSLVSILPGGREAWLCGDDSNCSVSPLVVAIVGTLTIIDAGKFTERFLYHITCWLSVLLVLSAFNIPPLGSIVYSLAAVGIISHLPALSATKGNAFLLLVAGYFVSAMVGAVESFLTVVFLIEVALLVRRLYANAITLIASTPTPLFFSFVSHVVPRYHFSRHQFFRADNPPESVATHREDAFDKMYEKWNKKFPKGLKISEFLSSSFSDLRFAGSNRVFVPFARILSQWCDPCTVIMKSDGVNLIDVDGHKLMDISGSYGVNVCGYERYKEFLSKGWDLVKDVGCVLGPLHPVLQENISILKNLSKKEEVSFHMSGTEAVMGAMRLVRFNTNKNLVVVFGGAYHGWWDGVQPMAGNERTPNDVLTLKDLDPMSLEVIKFRANEIAAVVINPLQAFHPNQPPPSDLVLASNTREAVSSSTKRYQEWLVTLRRLCNEKSIALIFDEVYTGFRLAPGGAQEYFDVVADMVVYGKTLGGGFPNGIICGPRWLMNRNDANKPLRVAYVIGTFAAHPLLLGAMNQFLKFLTDSNTPKLYDDLRVRTAKFVTETNKMLAEKVPLTLPDGSTKPPIQLASYSSVWTMLFQIPGRYHWMLQYYLKDEGVNLSWVGTGRLSLSLDFTDDDFVELQKMIIKACQRMKEDGWWYLPKDDVTAKKSEQAIKMSLAKEMGTALVKRIVGM